MGERNDYWARGLVERLTERAAVARSEGTGTALADAVHFEEAAKRIETLEEALRAVEDSGVLLFRTGDEAVSAEAMTKVRAVLAAPTLSPEPTEGA